MPVPIDRIFSHVAVEEHVLRSISALILCDVKSADSLYDALAKAITMTVEDYKPMSDTVYNDVKRDFDAKVFQKHFVADRIRLLKRHKVVR